MLKSIWVVIFSIFVIPQIASGQVISLGINGSEGFADSIVLTTIQISSDAELHGFSFGITHDPTILSIPTPNNVRQGTILSSLNNNSGPDFFNVNTAPGNGSGYTVACVTDLFAPFELIPPVSDAILLEVDYLIGPTAPVGAVTSLDFTDLLGLPPVQTVVVLQLLEVTPTTTGGTILVTQPLFLRADLDQSGTLSLIDGVLLLYRVSGLEPPGTCRDSDDINDDGLLTIGDAVYLFQYLFINGPAIPEPSGACGPDPGVEDNLDCISYAGCD